MLVVEDDAMTRDMVTRQLGKVGLMPEMDGFEVLEHLAGDARLRDIPVVVVKARDMADTELAHLAAGAEAA